MRFVWRTSRVQGDFKSRKRLRLCPEDVLIKRSLRNKDLGGITAGVGYATLMLLLILKQPFTVIDKLFVLITLTLLSMFNPSTTRERPSFSLYSKCILKSFLTLQGYLYSFCKVVFSSEDVNSDANKFICRSFTC